MHSRTKQTVEKVIIIGGGPCGATTALALSASGIECEVFERESEIQSLDLDNHRDLNGGSLTLHAGGLVMKSLGYEREWVDMRSRLREVRFTTPARELIATVQIDRRFLLEHATTLGFDPTVVDLLGAVTRPAFHQYLSNLCRGGGGRARARGPNLDDDGMIKYHNSKRFVEYEEIDGGGGSGTHKIIAHFSDGTQAEGDVLLGCDGVNSKVRRCMNARYGHLPIGDPDYFCGEKDFSGFSFWYCTGIMDEEQLKEQRFRTSVEFIFAHESAGIYYPISEHKHFTIYGSYLNSDPAIHSPSTNTYDIGWNEDSHAVSAAQALEDFTKWTKKHLLFDYFADYIPNLRAVNHLDSYYVNMLHSQHERWHQNHVLLLGDASHAQPPFGGGPGSNAAMYDSLCLANLLDCYHGKKEANVVDGKFNLQSVAHVFQTLFDIRSPNVRHACEVSKKVGNMYQLPNEEHAARNAMMRSDAESGALAQRVLSNMLDVFDTEKQLGFNLFAEMERTHR